MQAVLRYPKRLGGAICLSGWLMMPQSLVKWSSPANKATPIFWGHGEEDGVVQYALQVSCHIYSVTSHCDAGRVRYEGVV